MKRILENINLPKNSTIVVGVSGGADSMVLLYALNKLKEERNYNVICVHVNHNIRKTESKRDAKFVEDFCKKNNIEFALYSVDCVAEQEKTKQSIEEVARNLRYDCFKAELSKHKNAVLALAHHKDDNAETIFMNICRGAGTVGAMGIRKQEGIIRPLLNLTKNEIKEIAEKLKIAYVEDSTNNNIEYTRNYIRNKIFPEIEKVFPGAKNNLVNFASVLKEDNDYFESILPKESVLINQSSIEIEKGALKQPKPVAIRLIKFALDKKNWSKDFYKEHYNKIIELASLKNGSKIDLPHRKQAFVEYDKIIITKLITNGETGEIDFRIGKFSFLNHTFKVEKTTLEKVDYLGDSKFLDLDKIPQNAVLRTRKNGDIFKKLGAGAKKLNDYFTDKKIPLRQRDNIILLASGNNVLLVFGYDISESVKIDENTENVVRVDYK